MDKVEIKVNITNQLKLLRQSTFKDKLSFIDEDIQNAQRAKSTQVEIFADTVNKTLTIENDGQILSNPQALFSIAESEWDEDIQKNESPFGTGFFSNITVSDNIEIFSGHKHIVFDIGDMINNNRTDIKVNEVDEYYKGFKLVLNNFDYNEIGYWSIKERVQLLGMYVHEIDIYLDGDLQEKKELTEGNDDPFEVKIDNDQIKGWMSLTRYFDNDLKIFYKGRLVKKLEDFYYVCGHLHINDKTLNLTSPDRRDIIKDHKYDNFNEKIREYIRDLSIESFLCGDQSDVDDYIDAISRYADKDKLKNEMKFIHFKGSENEDISYLKGIALSKKKGKEINSFNDYEVFIRSEAAKQTGVENLELIVGEDIIQKAERAKGTYTSTGGYSSGITVTPEIKEEEREERKGAHSLNDQEIVFWMEFNEVDQYEYKLNIVRNYGLNLIISRNKMETSILKMLENQKIIHVSKLQENTRARISLYNTQLSNKEKRASMLLDMISRMVGFNDNMFVIGDLMVIKETFIEAIDTKSEIVEDSIVAIYDGVSNKVYMDRSTIDHSHLSESLDETLTLNDYKFLLYHLKDITNELGLSGIKDKEQVYEGIINTLAIA